MIRFFFCKFQWIEKIQQGPLKNPREGGIDSLLAHTPLVVVVAVNSPGRRRRRREVALTRETS